MSDLPLSKSGRTPLEVAVEAAHTAGRIQLERFAGEKQVVHKGRANIVTDVDTQSEKAILDLLHLEYPDFGLLAEETGSQDGETDYTWIVDPLDGTRNYASSIPHFAIVVALAQGNDMVMGVTYDPVRDEIFHAEKGKGAFLGNTPIHVSQRRRIAEAVLGCDMGYVDQRAHYALQLITSLWPRMQSIRVMGSAALGLAYTAAGRIDLYFHHNLEPWDLASGLLLIREAGGLVTDHRGDPSTVQTSSIIASNSALHAEFMNLTQGMPWRKM